MGGEGSDFGVVEELRGGEGDCGGFVVGHVPGVGGVGAVGGERGVVEDGGGVGSGFCMVELRFVGYVWGLVGVGEGDFG